MSFFLYVRDIFVDPIGHWLAQNLANTKNPDTIKELKTDYSEQN